MRAAIVPGLLVIAVLVVPAPTSASPGDLDPAFGRGGVIEMELGTFSGANHVEAQPDGRILVMGVDHQDEPLIVRLTDAGKPDPSFGDDGVVRLDLGSPTPFRTGLEIAPDGSIYVLGGAYFGVEQPNAPIARLRADGSLDPTFSGDGMARSPLDGTYTIEVTPDGGVAFAGAIRARSRSGDWVPTESPQRALARRAGSSSTSVARARSRETSWPFRTAGSRSPAAPNCPDRAHWP